LQSNVTAWVAAGTVIKAADKPRTSMINLMPPIGLTVEEVLELTYGDRVE
jgi:hypothetical protein